MEDMRINVFPKFKEICMEMPCCEMRTNMEAGKQSKQAEKSVTEFCYKSVNLSLEELKNVTIILHSNTRTVQIAKFPEHDKSHFKPTQANTSALLAVM